MTEKKVKITQIKSAIGYRCQTKGTLKALGIKKMKRRDKALVDKVSAAIILQSYLDSK